VGWQGKKPADYRSIPYAGAGSDAQRFFWSEGEKDADTLIKFGFAVFTFGGGDGLPDDIDEYLKRIFKDDRKLIIAVDNDDGGRKQGLKKEEKAHACGIKHIRIFDPASIWPGCPDGGDITDWFEKGGGTREKLLEIVDALPDWQPNAETRGFEGFEGSQGRRFSASEDPHEWTEPKPLPNGLSPVDAFDIRFLPDAIAPWVMDIANRLQCPPDYVAVSAMVALGATIGRRVGIKPQMHTDWIEFANLWGAFVGRPGWLKSPAMGEALKPLHHLEAQAIKKNEEALQSYLAELGTFKTRQQVKLVLDKEALKKDPHSKADSGMDLGDEPQKPPNIRYRTNDSSYESLGELLIDNPTGILVERDELISLLRHLDREDQCVGRGFYLSGWSGMQPYSFDRIGRGHRHIEAVCLSVLGNTQPAKISEYVRRANQDGAGGDGLIQRFGLLVWPDTSPDWKNVDEYPDSSARENAWAVFERTSKLDRNKALAMGASEGKFDKVPAFHFDEAALSDFEEFRAQLEHRVRSGELSPAFEGHVGKYRKLVPALALINHIADSGNGPVTQKSLLRALAFVTYLESHAQRVYGSTSESELAAAKAILKRIHSGDLPDGFTARDVHQKGWAHLTERVHVGAGLGLLVDLYYLAEIDLGTGPQGGRPKVGYSINPRIAS
jgi:putative DNA primase/helicase